MLLFIKRRIAITCKADVSKEFAQYQPRIDAQKAEVLSVNTKFFEAISTGNIDLMRSIWMNSPDSQVSYIKSNKYSV